MAENIRSSFPNFCVGPQLGTYCTMNTLSSPVTMQVKNSSGSTIRTYTFSPTSTLEPGPYRYSSQGVYVPGQVMPIKTFIMDIKDGWGGYGYIGIRSIEFYDEDNNLIPLTTANFIARSTTQYNTDYQPHYAFDTREPKDGTWWRNAWISQLGVRNNQRLVCTMYQTQYVSKIVINNAHSNGSYTDRASKNIKMYYTSSDYTNTTYQADWDSFIKIYDGVLQRHGNYNGADDQNMVLEGEPFGAHNEIVAIKYTGPKNQGSTYDGAPFYTLEKIGTSVRQYYIDDEGHTAEEVEYPGNIIRRWSINNSNFTLNLEQLVYVNDITEHWFGADAFAIDTYETSLLDHVPKGTGEISFTTTSGMSKYDTILIGPSSDADNPGAVETVYLHSYIGNDVSIRDYSGAIPTQYEYIEGDPVTVMSNAYLLCGPRPKIDANGVRDGYVDPKGSLYKIDLANYGAVIDTKTSATFSDVQAASWNSQLRTVSFVKGTNLIHYSNDNSKVVNSQKLELIRSDKHNYISLYDVDIVGSDVYKLQKEKLVLGESGVPTMETWDHYNYVEDATAPYTSSVTVVPEKEAMGYQDSNVITAIVRDQYGVGLLGKNVNFSIAGDTDGYLVPSDGNVVTDSNGVCNVQYVSGADYKEMAEIVVKSDGGNTANGSAFVTNRTNIMVKSNYVMEKLIWATENEILGEMPLMSRDNELSGANQVLCFARRSYPGGEWKWVGYWPDPDISDPDIDDRNGTTKDANVALITTLYQPFFNGIQRVHDQNGFRILNENSIEFPQVPVTQYNSPRDEYYTKITSEKEATDERRLSQNYISRHMSAGHTVDTKLNQYVFVQEARPKFWSEKNTTKIDYWIRLRPFSFSLNPDTLSIKVYELSYQGTSDKYDIAPLGTITLFDAGGGLEGIDFSYTFPDKFHHNATVFIEIEVYDEAPLPNIVTVSYWFRIIPDYNIPFIINKVPHPDAINVTINAPITFDVIDNGEGVDIDTLEVFINTRNVEFESIEYEPDKYHIVIDSLPQFNYGQQVQVQVQVFDKSTNKNLLRDGWIFHCVESTGPWFDTDEVTPGRCLEGVVRDTNDVSMQVYGINDTGVEYDSLKLEVGGKYRNIKVTPIIYRLK